MPVARRRFDLLRKGGAWRRLSVSIIALYAIYVVVANLVLASDWFETRVNAASDKVTVGWTSLHSWFPAHFSARGVSIRSNTLRMQSLTEIQRLSGWVSPVGLTSRRLSVYRLRAVDPVSRVRSAAMLESVRSGEIEHFPLIPGVDPLMPDSPREFGPFRPGWTVQVKGFRSDGNHRVVLGNYEITARGTVSGSMRYRVRGSLELDGTGFSLTDGQVRLNGQELVTQVESSGTYIVHPFEPYFHRGLEMLPYIGFDSELVGQLSSLDVLNFYLGVDTGRGGGGLSAQGSLSGRLVVDRGQVKSPTDLVVDAPSVRYGTEALVVESSGLIRLRPTEVDGGLSRLVTFELGRLDLIHRPSGDRLMATDGVEFVVTGTEVRIGKPLDDFTAEAIISGSGVPDLTVLNRFVPALLPLSILSGAGKMSATLLWEQGLMEGTMSIRSSELNLKVKDSPLTAQIDLELVFLVEPDSRTISISGSRLLVDDVNLDQNQSLIEPWSAQAEIVRGNVFFREGVAESARDDDSLRRIIDFADGELALAGEVSNIDFLDYLVKESRHVRFMGRGEFDASFSLEEGRILQESFTEFRLPDVRARFMDFEARGQGRIRGEFIEESSIRYLEVDASIDDVALVRTGSDRVFVEAPAVNFFLRGRAPDVTEPLDGIVVDFDIADARVADITVYNQYLPENEVLRLLAGSGTLTSHLSITNAGAGGRVELTAPGARVLVNSTPVTIDLLLRVELVDGDMDSRTFSLADSFLRVDNVKYADGTSLGDWATTFTFDEGTVHWITPLRVDAHTRLEMSSSGPLIRLLMGTYSSLKWVDDLLSVNDVTGSARLRLQPDSLVLNRLDISGEEIRIMANLRVGQAGTEGILFNRLGPFRAAVTFEGEHRDWHLFSARERFEQHPGY